MLAQGTVRTNTSNETHSGDVDRAKKGKLKGREVKNTFPIGKVLVISLIAAVIMTEIGIATGSIRHADPHNVSCPYPGLSLRIVYALIWSMTFTACVMGESLDFHL
jgi:hypothetical protein